MTSKKRYTEAFVWIWLPQETSPVIAGRLRHSGDTLVFNYGKSYLGRPDVIAIYDPELPLQGGELPLPNGLTMPGCIRDAAPDAWGRRVILNRLSASTGLAQANELVFLLESGSDRVGALDFQYSASVYEPRVSANATLDELLDSAARVEKGIPLTAELDQALFHGTSIGGARPKALIESNNKKYIAKFSMSSDIYSLVKAEFLAMRLGKLAGLNVAPVSLTHSAHRDVLLVERFDRVLADEGWQRKSMVSALTLFGLDEMMARYASYEIFAELIRQRFTHAPATLKELFARIVFNILTGNTDDHARNHAAFWDGKMLSLTPAYDICPQSRTGNEASQAMLIQGENRMSRISTCLAAAHHFLLSSEQAREIVTGQIQTIGENWGAVCDEANVSEVDRRLLWGRAFLNPYAFENLEGSDVNMAELANTFRRHGAARFPRRGAT